MLIDAYCVLGVDREYDLTAPALVQAMDRAGVDRAVIAPVDRYLAVDNQAGNDFILQAAAGHPGRFFAACSVNPWCGPAGLAELRRAIAAGARLIVLHPAVQGYLANDELVWPVLEVAQAERLPVYIHTGPPGNATPWQLVDLAERFPAVDLIMGHCGATDFWYDVNDAALAAPNIYIESSLSRPFAFVQRIPIVGLERCLMGSFAPNNEFGFEWDQMRQAVSPEAFGPVCGGNLRRLLEKRGPL
jgi:predicted TIM-barrel fold metal-dependent hydrolase